MVEKAADAVGSIAKAVVWGVLAYKVGKEIYNSVTTVTDAQQSIAPKL